MLVLTRKSEEGIRIGNDVKVVVLEIKDGHVKLGIEAPSTLSIYREEIYLKIQKENLLASRVEEKSIDELTDVWRKIKSNE